jgi:glycosyltransferase involved in cell wall biosynthesis
MTAARGRAVYILCAGHTARAGGIGRFIGNLVHGLAAVAPELRLRVVDTRGSGAIGLAPFVFAAALANIAVGAACGRIALLHVNLASRGSTVRKLIVVALGAALRLPIVIHLHGARFDAFYRSRPAWARRAIAWMFARADRVIALGPHWQRFVTAEIGVPPGRIVMIANGVARPAAPAAIAAPDPPHILFLGRLGQRKGVDALLAALASPALAARRWRATLAGDGDVAGWTERARRLGLDQRVRLPGWVHAETVEQLLASATMLVLPSHAEGLPMAVIEALAYRIVVVTTPVGAVPDFLADGESAVLVPPGDADALARAIAGLLDDAALRARIADGGHAAYRRHFDIEAVSRRIRDVYADVLAHRRMAAADDPSRAARISPRWCRLRNGVAGPR